MECFEPSHTSDGHSRHQVSEDVVLLLMLWGFDVDFDVDVAVEQLIGLLQAVGVVVQVQVTTADLRGGEPATTRTGGKGGGQVVEEVRKKNGRIKVAATSLKLEVQLHVHAYQIGTNT